MDACVHNSKPSITETIFGRAMKNGKIDKYLFEGGYAQASATSSTSDNFSFYFYNQDHLGNIREVVNANGAVQQVTNYYPFGAPYADTSASTNADFQPYKYNGKELDKMHGLNTYDYGARQHDPILARWDRIDPLAEKYYNVSPYAYCGNSPEKFVDIKGEEPGDFFNTKDDAAKDFGRFYNPISIIQGREYGSSIYVVRNSNGDLGYTYSVANVGVNGEVVVSSAPFGEKAVATIHTHGCFSNGNYFDNEFSGIRANVNGRKVLVSASKRKMETGKNDIGNANKRQIDSYLVTPNGSLQKYDPKNNKISIISNDMPSDSNDPEALNSNYVSPNNFTYLDYLDLLKEECLKK